MIFESAEKGETAALPPEQPATGPGGAEYGHDRFSQRLAGRGAGACWVFTPTGPAPGSAPVVVFFHGWAGVNPINYGGWIVHLVRRGNVVLYPVYQASALAPFGQMLLDAADGIRAGLGHLEKSGPVRPVIDRFVFAGHSLGGLIASKCAALGPDKNFPDPRALMLVQPGWGRVFSVPLADLGEIPADRLVLVALGEEDRHLSSEQPLAIYRAFTGIPEQNRNLIMVRSDLHGSPPLIADHSAPLSERAGVGPPLTPEAALRREKGFSDLGLRRARADALDFYGHWKLLDALMSAAFEGRCRESALGDTPAQRFMGVWSDGVPVREMAVSTRADGRFIDSSGAGEK